MSDAVIKVENLSKVYKLYNDPVDRVKEALNPFRKKYHHDFYALNDVNFEVKKGETIGIIGKNGSGKSTLLKILTGVLTPSSGHYHVKGKISSLLELGAGFNSELSGLENVYFNGAILGFTKDEIDEKLEAILEFADIGEFVHQPVKMYSSGMQVRLAFAVAISVDPDILIVDEALAVGDMFFQAKCMTKMKQMIDSGVTLVFVSHSPGAIKSLCNKAILLDAGGVIQHGTPSEVTEKYFAMKVSSDQKLVVSDDVTENLQDVDFGFFKNNKEFKKMASFQRIQNGMANFSNIQLLDTNGNEIRSVDYGQDVILRMGIEIKENIHELSFGYHIRDGNGVDVVYSDAVIEGYNLINVKKGDKYVIDWKFESALMHGDYTVACVLSIPIDLEISKVVFCDFIPVASQFQVACRKNSYLYGKVHWNNVLEVKKL